MPSILVVEDDTQAANIISLILQQDGYFMKFVSDGEQCLKYVKREKPDLILMDIMMPVLDGYTTAARLYENEETRKIPILVCTAKSNIQDLFNSSGSGNIVGFLQKPFEGAVLRAKVKKILGMTNV